MAYISSNANRWYVGREDQFGQIPTVTAANRIPAVRLAAQHNQEKTTRRDKTGTRTWQGLPSGVRRNTSFNLTTYMRDWPDPTVLPAQGPLLEAALGGSGALFGGGVAAAGCDTSTLIFAAPHSLTPGDAVGVGGEIRFVAAVADGSAVVLNAPLSIAPPAGFPIGPAAAWRLAYELPSVSLFDYWDPASAVQRVLSGAAVDQMSIRMNSDFHELDFRGVAQDLIDSSSFVAGQGQATAFPPEPVSTGFSYSPVPGNLGQVWLGVIPGQFHTVSQATIDLRNNLLTRGREYGSELPRAITPGPREVSMTLEFFSQDDDATTALYQAARQRSPVTVMFQMGQQGGQLMGVWMKSLIPDVPKFDDTDLRLRWTFNDTRAQGTIEDEIMVAFG
jgi:hypothetical protein